MQVNEIVGLLTAVLVLAGVSYAIYNGTQTAQILKASFDGFGGLVSTATGQGIVGGFQRGA